MFRLYPKMILYNTHNCMMVSFIVLILTVVILFLQYLCPALPQEQDVDADGRNGIHGRFREKERAF